MVTGLVTNSYPNVPCEYSHVTRAMCHSVFSNKIPHIVRFYDKEMVKEPVGIAVIEGRLSFEYYVKCIKQKRIVKDMQDHPSSFEQTFRDFLLFKTFFKAKRPLIIAEGKSDRIYLRAAARTIFATDTIFYDAGTKAFNFDVFQFPQRVHDLTGLASGTGNLTRGLVKLRDFTRRYPNLNPSQPVIFLIDFDEGSKSFVEQAKKLFNAKISSTNTEDFVRLMPGIFLVRTPSVKGSEPSFIESFLPSKVLTTEIEGKMFSSAAKIDPERNFGKVRMAQHVSLNSDHIKIDGFMPLLERIRTAIISV